MDLEKKAFQDVLSILVAIRFVLTWLLHQLAYPLALQLEKAVHELVDCIDFDYQKLFIEDFIVFGVDEAQTLCKEGSSLEQILVFEVVDATLAHCFEVVHKNEGSLFGLEAVLFAKGVDPLLYFLNFRLILYLRQA